MPDAIDELYTKWKENPADAATTLALCDALRGSGRLPLIQLVGEVTARDHASNVPALVATARMYMEAQRLQEAQTVLVAAGKVAPRDPSVYRWLGEVLLRRGDADRAEKVLERAIQFGGNDSDTRTWIERAKVFRPMQSKGGTRAVAAEIAKTAGLQASLPRMSALDDAEEVTTEIFSAPRKEPPAAPKAEAAKKANNSEVFIGGASDDSSTTNPVAPEDLDQAIGADDEMTLARPSPLASQKPIDMTAPPPKAHPPPVKLPGGRLPPPPAPPSPPGQLAGGHLGAQVVTGAPPATGTPLAAQAVALQPPPAVAPPLKMSSRPPPLPVSSPAPKENGPALPPYMPPPAVPALVSNNPFMATDASVPSKKRAPDPRDVLDALQLAGVFEPDGGAPVAAWDRGAKGPRRLWSTISLSVATLLFLGSGYGIYRYIQDNRAAQHALAEQILNVVEGDLQSGRLAALTTTEEQIGRAFDLDSRSPRAAIAWVRERALVGILKGGADVALEDAITRAREVKVSEDKLAFAHLASFLFQGDTVGAAGLMPKWDGPAANDAWYQLICGATLERAGAPRAAERYATAARLAPELLIAEAMVARAIAIDGDAQKAGELARAFRQKHPNRAEGVALVALSWGRDPTRGSDEPPEVADTIAHAAELPVPFAFVPHAMQALRAIDKRSPADAKAHIEKGLANADGPGVASWLGGLAIDAGDEQLARKAALAAVSFSAVYQPARVLAARVALLGDRLDEAVKATEELEANSPDVAVVRAAAAYERVDADGLGRALDAVAPEARRLPFLAPLAYSPDVLFGRLQLAPEKLVATANDEAPWADVLAMDMALDAGDLDTAQKIAAEWRSTERRPLRALRLARLARYAGRFEDADPLSETALKQGTVTVRSLSERVFVLVGRGKHGEVAPLLAKYPLVLGQALTTWLSAYATASAGKVDDARGKVAQLDPPPSTSPLPVRAIAAMAMGATRDHRRGPEYVRALLSTGLAHPDFGTAAVQLGGRKVDRPGRPPLYFGP